jgi:methyl-accepting chemotaxis protein
LQTSVNETVALRSDSNTLHAAISGPLRTNRAAADELLALLSRQATDAASMAASQELTQRAEALRIASFTLWEVSVDQLDRLLRARIKGVLVKRNEACLVVGLFVLGAGFLFWTVVRSITVPLNQLRGAAELDLITSVPERTCPDEVGDLARAIHTMTENLRSFLSEVGQGVGTMAAASTELATVSQQTATGVRNSSERAAAVAAAAKETSSSSASVANGMGEAKTNLNAVASATEEMASTIGEIANNSERARAIAA